MKKILTLAALAGVFAFSSCGPSKEELEKKEQARQDSIKRYNDSVADADAKRMQAEADSMKKVEEANKAVQQHIADSLHEDSVKRKLIKKKK